MFSYLPNTSQFIDFESVIWKKWNIHDTTVNTGGTSGQNLTRLRVSACIYIIRVQKYVYALFHLYGFRRSARTEIQPIGSRISVFEPQACQLGMLTDDVIQ